MTDIEIQIGQEQIAKMLGWKYLSHQDVKDKQKWVKAGWYTPIHGLFTEKSHHEFYRGRRKDGLPFMRDWNEIMKAIDFIEDLGHFVSIKKIYIINEDLNHPHECLIQGGREDTIEEWSVSVINHNKKLATYLALASFAKSYNIKNEH